MAEEYWDIDEPKGCLKYVAACLLLMLIWGVGGVVHNELKLATRLGNYLNAWVWENGGEYKNAAGLCIVSITTDMITNDKTYKCNFITLVKDDNGEFNNYVAGSATIIEYDKKFRREAKLEKYYVLDCKWQGTAKPLYLYNSEERMWQDLQDGLY
jgi:hypothetical protein